MIHIRHKAAFSWHFEIARDADVVGSLDFARLTRNGSFTISGQHYELKRDGWFGSLTLHSNSRIIARAERIGVFRARFRIHADDRTLDLRGRFIPPSAVLAHGDVVLATIARTSLFRRNVEVDTMQNVPLPLAVFATAVMILYWRTVSRSSH